jgi:hypothetical protein
MTTEIAITPLGRLANRMIQYLAAWKLKRELGDAEVGNPNLPEWGLSEQRVAPPSNQATLMVDRQNPMPFPALCRLARSGNYSRILIDEYMQRLECLPDRWTSASLFSAEDHSYGPRDDELLIHIRSGDLTWGIPNYPLIPAGFYERIIRMSGLKPVFMGEIEPNAYCEGLKTSFPGAKFLSKQGPIQDFRTLESHALQGARTS